MKITNTNRAIIAAVSWFFENHPDLSPEAQKSKMDKLINDMAKSLSPLIDYNGGLGSNMAVISSEISSNLNKFDLKEISPMLSEHLSISLGQAYYIAEKFVKTGIDIRASALDFIELSPDNKSAFSNMAAFITASMISDIINDNDGQIEGCSDKISLVLKHHALAQSCLNGSDFRSASFALKNRLLDVTEYHADVDWTTGSVKLPKIISELIKSSFSSVCSPDQISRLEEVSSEFGSTSLSSKLSSRRVAPQSEHIGKTLVNK